MPLDLGQTAVIYDVEREDRPPLWPCQMRKMQNYHPPAFSACGGKSALDGAGLPVGAPGGAAPAHQRAGIGQQLFLFVHRTRYFRLNRVYVAMYRAVPPVYALRV